MIRVLQESDATAYQQLRLEGLRGHPDAFGSTYEREAAFSLETVQARVRPSSEQFVLGAFDDDGTLLGIVTLVRDSGVKTAHKGHIYGMYVARVAQGRGLGRALLLDLVGRTREMNGLEQLHLTVVAGNEAPERLYLSLGFEIYGRERNALKFLGYYADEILMALRLYP